MNLDIWPTHTTFRPGQPVGLTITTDRDQPATLTVTHLTDTICTRDLDLPAGQTVVDLDPQPHGGYGVALGGETGAASTAFDVLDSPTERPRYGFLSEFAPERDDIDTAVDGMRQLHLNVIQFYDWMYRHADLVADDDEFTDALGRTLSHRVTRDLAKAVTDTGGLPLGYAAVYAAGRDYADDHPEQILYHHDGQPWMLADFLWITNPSDHNPWRNHIINQFRHAIDAIGFAGLHLDQYGNPKTALDHDDQPVDLADVFPSFIDATRKALPDATLIFNNVNNYPTWTTAPAPQDATYIEVWSPHDTYHDLATLITGAKHPAPTQPVILAAYLEPFAQDSPERASWAAQLALATVFSHGGHYLLCGEGNGVLTDPYYPSFHRADPETHRILRRYFDHAVALGDLLYDPGFVDITDTHIGGINDDILVASRLPTSGTPEAGSMWARAVTDGSTTLIHLIDLSRQDETCWNAGKNTCDPTPSTELRIRTSTQAQAWWTSPSHGPRLHQLPANRDGDYLTIPIESFRVWGTVVLRPAP